MERLCTLRHYSEHRSLTCAVLVCSLVIAPALFASLALDMISLGWRRNKALYVREFLETLLIKIDVTLQLHAIVPSAKLSRRQVVFISLVATIGCNSTAMLLTELWVFLTPFSCVFHKQTWLLCFIMSIVRVIEYQNLSKNRELRSQIIMFPHTIVIEATFLPIGPLYNALVTWLTIMFQFTLEHQGKSSCCGVVS